MFPPRPVPTSASRPHWASPPSLDALMRLCPPAQRPSQLTPLRLQAELPAHGQQLEFDFCVPPSLSSASPTDAAVGTGPIDEQSFAAFRSEIAGPRAPARTSAACGSRAAAFSCLDTLQPYGITRSLIAIIRSLIAIIRSLHGFQNLLGQSASMLLHLVSTAEMCVRVCGGCPHA